MSSWIYTADHSEYHMGGYEQQDNRFDINTIAKALSCINRFCGHTSRPYSVAEHSLLVCDILRDQGYSCLVQMAGLLHDAHEAYIGDVSSPVKWELGIAWDSFEHRHMMALRKHFALITTYAAYRREIKQADLVALATERIEHLVGRREYSALASSQLVQVVGVIELIRRFGASVDTETALAEDEAREVAEPPASIGRIVFFGALLLLSCCRGLFLGLLVDPLLLLFATVLDVALLLLLLVDKPGLEQLVAQVLHRHASDHRQVDGLGQWLTLSIAKVCETAR